MYKLWVAYALSLPPPPVVSAYATTTPPTFL